LFDNLVDSEVVACQLAFLALSYRETRLDSLSLSYISFIREKYTALSKLYQLSKIHSAVSVIILVKYNAVSVI